MEFSIVRMESRKIQLTGGASYSVTLPKDWVERAGLAAGDRVAFQDGGDGGLVIYPGLGEATPQRTRTEIEVPAESGEATFRRIVAAYLAGYDVIAVKGKRSLSPAARKAVREAARRIIGLEILEEQPNGIVLQDFLDPRELHVEKGVRRMEALARAMQADALAAFRGEVEELEERDDEVDKLYWMVNKQYHALLRDPAYGRRMGLTASAALNFLLVARIVERTADHARRIAQNVAALRGGTTALAKVESKLERQARRAVELFADALAAFHKADADEANRIIEESRAFQEAQEALVRESFPLGGENVVHVAYALESIARTAAYAADVAETAINHHVIMQA